MIQVDISGKPAKLWFKHGSEGHFLPGGGAVYTMVTECRVVDPVTQESITHARAVCHENDNFCKNTGRKLALQRAIKDYDKATRKKIWDAYFKARGKF